MILKKKRYILFSIIVIFLKIGFFIYPLGWTYNLKSRSEKNGKNKIRIGYELSMVAKILHVKLNSEHLFMWVYLLCYSKNQLSKNLNCLKTISQLLYIINPLFPAIVAVFTFLIISKRNFQSPNTL